MRHVCAYLLAAMGSNAANAANMKAILASVGVEADDKQLELVIQKFGNKNIEKVIAEGSVFLAAMGGGGGGAVAASGSAPAGGGDAPKAEEKKEEKKEESEESDDDMGFGLFD